MSFTSASGIAIILAAALSACGSSTARTYTSRTPEGTTTTTTTDETAKTPVLTSGNVPTETTVAAPAPETSRDANKPARRWSDSEIMAAAAAADAAQEADAKLVRERSRTARVERFAQQMILDQRDLDASQARLERKIPGAQSGLSAKVEEARRATAHAAHANASSGFDHAFMDAQIDFSRALLKLLDEEMIPNAQSAELKSYLQSLRAKTSSRMQQAVEISTQLP
jgi:predicted outer membrane protein